MPSLANFTKPRLLNFLGFERSLLPFFKFSGRHTWVRTSQILRVVVEERDVMTKGLVNAHWDMQVHGGLASQQATPRFYVTIFGKLEGTLSIGLIIQSQHYRHGILQS
jgi:hypothetical protein